MNYFDVTFGANGEHNSEKIGYVHTELIFSDFEDIYQKNLSWIRFDSDRFACIRFANKLVCTMTWENKKPCVRMFSSVEAIAKRIREKR